MADQAFSQLPKKALKEPLATLVAVPGRELSAPDSLYAGLGAKKYYQRVGLTSAPTMDALSQAQMM